MEKIGCVGGSKLIVQVWSNNDYAGDVSADLANGECARARHHPLPVHALLRQRGCPGQDAQEGKHPGKIYTSRQGGLF